MKPLGDTTLLVTVVLAFLAPVLLAIGVSIAFGYDEAVYAQLTRHWLTGAPASGWDLHRPPGLSVLGLVPQTLAPGTDWAQRLIGAIAGAGVVVAAWSGARMVGGRLAGTVAAVAMAAAAPLQVESASFLTDVPSTLVLLAVAVLIWRHVSGPEPFGRSFDWIGVLAATAFYLRYGAVVGLAGLGVAKALVAPRKVIAGWRWVAAAVGVFLAALVPHFAVAIAETGTPWGILASAGRGGWRRRRPAARLVRRLVPVAADRADRCGRGPGRRRRRRPPRVDARLRSLHGSRGAGAHRRARHARAPRAALPALSDGAARRPGVGRDRPIPRASLTSCDGRPGDVGGSRPGPGCGDHRHRDPRAPSPSTGSAMPAATSARWPARLELPTARSWPPTCRS